MLTERRAYPSSGTRTNGYEEVGSLGWMVNLRSFESVIMIFIVYDRIRLKESASN